MKRWIVKCQPDGRYTEASLLVDAMTKEQAKERALYQLNIGRKQDVQWVAMNVLEIAILEWAE